VSHDVERPDAVPRGVRRLLAQHERATTIDSSYREGHAVSQAEPARPDQAHAVTEPQPLPLGADLVSAVDTQPDCILQPVVAVQTTTVLPDLYEPAPDFLGRRIHRHGPGHHVGRAGHQLVAGQHSVALALGGAPVPEASSEHEQQADPGYGKSARHALSVCRAGAGGQGQRSSLGADQGPPHEGTDARCRHDDADTTLEAMERGEILVGVDGSAESDAAVAWAVTEARARGCGVHIVHCCESRYYGLWTTTRTLRDGLRALARPLVDDAIELARRLDPELRVGGGVIVAAPARALVRLSARASLVVVGRSGRGAISHLLLGSAARHLLAAADCSAVSVGCRADGPAVSAPERVVAAVVRPESHERTLRLAFGEAKLHRVPLRVVTVLARTMPGAETGAAAVRGLATALIPWQAQYPTVRVTTSTMVGTLDETLAVLCTHRDLLVLGHHRHSPHALDLLGPRITSAMHAVHCPIAVAHEAPTATATVPSAEAVTGTAARSAEPAWLAGDVLRGGDVGG
jgi:nucleotide-binding universal stress UspA family protein